MISTQVHAPCFRSLAPGEEVEYVIGELNGRTHAVEVTGPGGAFVKGAPKPKEEEATLGDLREAEATLEDTERIARRVFGGAHPLVVEMELALRCVREALRAREMQLPGYDEPD